MRRRPTLPNLTAGRIRISWSEFKIVRDNRILRMPDFAARRERLWQAVQTEGLDGLLVSNPVNVTYLTGFSGDSSYLAMSGSRTILISDGRFTEQIAEECPGLDAHIAPPTQLIP